MGVAGRLKKRPRPAVKAGLSDRQKRRIGQQYTRTADMWERRYAEVARRQFGRERARVLKVLDREKSRKQAPSVSWDEVSMGWQQVYDQAGDEWRSAFVPLMQGTIEDQCAQYSAAFGMAFDVRLLYAEQWFDEHTMSFAENVIGTSERELADLLQSAQREGWSIPDMENAIGDLFDGWMDGRPPSRVADWIGERQPRWRRELIARTETIRSSGAGINKLFGQWGVEYKEWLVTQDDRTCSFCMEMNGKMIPIDGTYFEQGSSMTLQIGDKLRSLSFGYGKVDHPPLHPACRCCLLPYKESWAAMGVEPLTEPLKPARTIMDGPDAWAYPVKQRSSIDMIDNFVKGSLSEDGQTLQEAARRQFGGKWVYQPTEKINTDIIDDTIIDVANLMQHTQEQLAELGITHVRLYRGMGLPATTQAGTDTAVMNPISSWTSNQKVAEMFAQLQGSRYEAGVELQSFILTSDVPVGRILTNGKLIDNGGMNLAHEWLIVGDEPLNITMELVK